MQGLKGNKKRSKKGTKERKGKKKGERSYEVGEDRRKKLKEKERKGRKAGRNKRTMNKARKEKPLLCKIYFYSRVRAKIELILKYLISIIQSRFLTVNGLHLV